MIRKALATFVSDESPSYKEERKLEKLGDDVLVIDHFVTEDEYDSEENVKAYTRWRGRTIYCFTEDAVKDLTAMIGDQYK